MIPSQQLKDQKRFSVAIESNRETSINDYDVRERSFSSKITYNPEMVPKLKPKKSLICPSPICLTANKLNLSKEQIINRITRDSDTSMSFDGDDFSMNRDKSGGTNSDLMKEIRQTLTTYRSRTKSEYFIKDDETILTSKVFADEYSNLASKVLVPKVFLSSSKALIVESTNDYHLTKLTKNKKRYSSIIGFLEDSCKNNNSITFPIQTTNKSNEVKE